MNFVPNGPIIAPSEFDPSAVSKSAPSELDTMVSQVTAVLPQVPHNVIRRDLGSSPDNPSSLLDFVFTVTTNNVDATITNLLEGRVKYTPSSPSVTTAGASRRTSASQLFRRKVPSSSTQRHLSLEERKRELLQNARR